MSNTFYVTKSPDDIQHYGVLGMKWGIRRYQDVNGSYTQKGLKRLNQTRQIYEQAKANRNKDMNSRLLYKRAKRQLKDDTKQLKRDYRADKGRDLYSEGKTVTPSTAFKVGTGAAILGGAYVTRLANRAFAREGLIQNMNRLAGRPVTNKGFKYILGAMGVGVASTAVGIGATIKKASENKKLRAYYGHRRNTDRLQDERAKAFGTPSKKDQKEKYVEINGSRYRKV